MIFWINILNMETSITLWRTPIKQKPISRSEIVLLVLMLVEHLMAYGASVTSGCIYTRGGEGIEVPGARCLGRMYWAVMMLSTSYTRGNVQTVQLCVLSGPCLQGRNEAAHPVPTLGRPRPLPLWWWRDKVRQSVPSQVSFIWLPYNEDPVCILQLFDRLSFLAQTFY